MKQNLWFERWMGALPQFFKVDPLPSKFMFYSFVVHELGTCHVTSGCRKLMPCPGLAVAVAVAVTVSPS